MSQLFWPRSGEEGRRSAALFLLLFLAFPGAAPASSDSAIRPGHWIEIELERDQRGRVVADDVEFLDEPRDPELRGPVTGFDPATGLLQVLDWSFVVDGNTRFESGTTLDDLIEGVMLEVDGEAIGSGGWRPEEIETERMKTSWKVKGTVTAVHGDPAQPEAVEVDGLLVIFTPTTDLGQATDRIAEELFRDLREEEEIRSRPTRERPLLGGLSFSGSLRHNFRGEREFGLGEGSRRDLSEPSLRLEISANPIPGWRIFSQNRWIGQYALRDRSVPEGSFDESSGFEIRQLYVTGRDIGGRPFGVIMGKQRFKDEREFLYDEYLDAIRFYAYGLRPLVLEASWIPSVAPLEDKFETWDDWLLQARLYPGEDWAGRLYALFRDDTSDRGRDVRYYGMSLNGSSGPIRTWLELSLLRGSDKGQRQDAWAMDVGLAAQMGTWPGRPGVWLGWAQGSGDQDPDDDVSQAFRQTGYEDNSERIWGLASMRSYGELLDPELTNLRTWVVGVGLRPAPFLSLDVSFHGFRLDRVDDEFDQTDLRWGEEPLDGIRTDLGHELDFVLGWRDVVEDLHLIGRLGRFDPGESFGPDARVAWLQMLELRWDF